MKKSVIITIFILLIASLLVVNFFGLKIDGIPDAGVYVESITPTGFEFTNRNNITDEKYLLIKKIVNENNYDDIHYAGYFINGTYDFTEESLSTNPNRVKVLYDVSPDDATNKNVLLSYDKDTYSGKIYYDELTGELVFIKATSVSITMTALDGSTKEASIKITLKK